MLTFGHAVHLGNGNEESEPLPASTERAMTASTPTLGLGFELRWIVTPDGGKHALGQAQGRLLTALVDLHEEAPEATFTLQELSRLGWPGEQVEPEVGANRVHVALAHLRRLGMRDVIERCTRGYRLTPCALVSLLDSGETHPRVVAKVP